MKNLMYIFLLTLLWACGSSRSEEKKSLVEDNFATAVKTGNVLQKEVSIPVYASGLIASQTEMKLSFKTGGVIERIFVREGSSVYRGQLLASLNMSEISAQVKQAKVSLDKANRDLQRAKNLYTDSVTTLEQLQNANTQQEVSLSSLEIAQFNQRYSQIYSPVNGKVLRKFTEANELIGPSMPVFLIGSTEAAWVVKAGLTDKDVVRIQNGDLAKVQMDAHPGKEFKAFITQIEQSANPQTGTYEVELQIENPENLPILSGFVADVKIFPGTNQNSLTIPVNAMVEADGQTAFVYVLKEKQKVNKTRIRIGSIYENEVIVLDGLQKGDQIVVEGADYLKDKATVKIVK